ncbi:unnamed protein product [Cyclocybe aegerita]|uniref:Uncharacterized protein n=1 Tax=Cyclocybe aegerita TaxID=1973307 RepID=A0A8S0W4E5_CYCAE|nr:unnamed protein product [Cyclocybe aegerita]
MDFNSRVKSKLADVENMLRALDDFEHTLKEDLGRERSLGHVGSLQNQFLQQVHKLRKDLEGFRGRLNNFLAVVRAPKKDDIEAAMNQIRQNVSSYKKLSEPDGQAQEASAQEEKEVGQAMNNTKEEIRRMSTQYRRESTDVARKSESGASEIKFRPRDSGSSWTHDDRAPRIFPPSDRISRPVFRSRDSDDSDEESKSGAKVSQGPNPFERKIMKPSDLQSIADQVSQGASYGSPPVSEGLRPRPANMGSGARSFHGGSTASQYSPMARVPVGQPHTGVFGPSPNVNSLGYPIGPSQGAGGSPAYYAHSGDGNVDRRTTGFGGFNSPPLPMSHYGHGGTHVHSQSIGSFTGSQASTDTSPSLGGEGYSAARDSYYSVVGGGTQAPAGYSFPQGHPASSSYPVGAGSAYTAGGSPGPSSQCMGWPSSSAAYQSSSSPSQDPRDPREPLVGRSQGWPLWS